MAGWRDRLRLRLSGLGMVLLCALSMPVHAIVIRTAAQEGTEPKFVAGGGERIVGMCVDIYRAIEQVDPELQIVGDQNWKPLIRAYSELEHGQLDIACAVQRIGQRERRFDFIGPPLYNNEYRFLARINDPVKINNWEDLRRLAPDNTVLINRGFAAGDIIRAQGDIPIDESATNQVLNLQKLVAGRGRLFFHRGRDLRKLLERTGNTGKVRILPQIMLSSPVYFATSKLLAPQTRDRLERALFQLEKSGELDRLIRKWD